MRMSIYNITEHNKRFIIITEKVSQNTITIIVTQCEHTLINTVTPVTQCEHTLINTVTPVTQCEHTLINTVTPVNA